MKFAFRAVLAGAALAFAATSPSAFAAAPLKSLHITFKETLSPVKQKPVSRTSEMWLKDNKMRIRQGNLMIVSDGARSYIFSPKDPKKQMQVITIPASQRVSSISSQINKMVSPLIKQMKKVGKTKMMGYPVDVYQASDPKLKATNKTWVANINGSPIFLKEERKRPEGTMTIQVTSLKVNPALSNTLFTRPAGYKVLPAPSAPARKGAAKK